jgi:hypothetical protein
MKGMLLAWLPESFFPLLIVGIGFALILGIISRQRAFGFIGFIVLFLLISPFVYALFDQLPVWLLLAIFVVVIFSAFRAILGFCFGKGATDQFVGQVMFAAFSMPFRLLGRLFQGRRRF